MNPRFKNKFDIEFIKQIDDYKLRYEPLSLNFILTGATVQPEGLIIDMLNPMLCNPIKIDKPFIPLFLIVQNGICVDFYLTKNKFADPQNISIDEYYKPQIIGNIYEGALSQLLFNDELNYGSGNYNIIYPTSFGSSPYLVYLEKI
jgi:hypothetical protein